jgi:hypothetical protein
MGEPSILERYIVSGIFLFKKKLGLVISARNRWPKYASYREDVEFRDEQWNRHFKPNSGVRPVWHDNNKTSRCAIRVMLPSTELSTTRNITASAALGWRLCAAMRLDTKSRSYVLAVPMILAKLKQWGC